MEQFGEPLHNLGSRHWFYMIFPGSCAEVLLADKAQLLKLTVSGITVLVDCMRAISEGNACSHSKEKFINDFAAPWNKVMNLDRF